MSKRSLWIITIMLVGAVTYLLVSGLEKEMSQVEVVSDESMLRPMISGDISEDPSRWDFDDAQAFFVEYRLERDRVRGQELEMLNDMINNPQVGEDARREAEIHVLNLVELMEKELIVENMLKAQGYHDALLFSRQGMATVMVYAEELSENDYLRIAEMVSVITGVSREHVQVIQHS